MDVVYLIWIRIMDGGAFGTIVCLLMYRYDRYFLLLTRKRRASLFVRSSWSQSGWSSRRVRNCRSWLSLSVRSISKVGAVGFCPSVVGVVDCRLS
jgi:hypothetical protein